MLFIAKQLFQQSPSPTNLINLIKLKRCGFLHSQYYQWRITIFFTISFCFNVFFWVIVILTTILLQMFYLNHFFVQNQTSEPQHFQILFPKLLQFKKKERAVNIIPHWKYIESFEMYNGLPQYILHQSIVKTVIWFFQNESQVLFQKSFGSLSANKMKEVCC